LLWDGYALPGTAQTRLTTKADTQDGVCDTTTTCASAPGASGGNTDVDIDTLRGYAGTAGAHNLIEIPVNSLTWLEAGCVSGMDPNCTGGDPALCCCFAAVFGDEGGDLPITNFNFVLRPTTDISTVAWEDKNGNGCSMSGAGPVGPVTEVGMPPAGPCCVVGQEATVVSVGVGPSGAAPLYDLTFSSKIPSTISACGAFQAGSCTVSTDPCDF
jgi:hypothetical protein